MVGRLLTLFIVSPLFLGVSFGLLNIFLNMIDQVYDQFLVFKANDYSFQEFLDVHFELAYVYTMNMDYWFIYVIVGAYLVWQGFLSPFYDISKSILTHRTVDVGKNGVAVDIEATADKEKPAEDIIIEQPVRSNEPTQIQIVPVPMLTQEQLNAINNLTEVQKQEQKTDTTVQNPVEEVKPQEAPVKEKSVEKFPTAPKKKDKFSTPAKPKAFKPNRNLDTPHKEQQLGKVFMNVPSEIKELGKKDGE